MTEEERQKGIRATKALIKSNLDQIEKNSKRIIELSSSNATRANKVAALYDDLRRLEKGGNQ